MSRLERLAPALAFLACVAITTIFLIGSRAFGAEVPERILAGIAMVESGSTYRDGLVIDYRDRRIGADGEVSAFQLSPAALLDLHASRARCARDQAYAVRCARRLLSRLYDATGSWTATVAAYHRGLGGRNRLEAIVYAARVAAAGGAQ